MAENTQPTEPTEEAAPKTPGKFRTFFSTHKRKLAAAAILGGTAAVAYSRGKSAGANGSSDSTAADLEALNALEAHETNLVTEA